ncbi:ferredoxin [Actinoplanes sp. N902-109]|uniref:ferredoxin n=1 Tax=Actinoplanes sp. (strain N902-109) TaxID=649831 RepID=UPI0003296196|nr:ferredoxin [Actinoplanes sp. N902-109]AGL15953.1 ferredoxin [Actinoplanes sp. N902-109]
MKIRVDPDGCMGHGMCQALAPDVYEINETSGVNEMGDFEVAPGQEAAATRGAAACPERAIAVLDSFA